MTPVHGTITTPDTAPVPQYFPGYVPEFVPPAPRRIVWIPVEIPDYYRPAYPWQLPELWC